MKLGVSYIRLHEIAEILAYTEQSGIQDTFSNAEVQYCKKQARSDLHFAARLAAKLSFLKAFGLGKELVRLNAIEVRHDDLGKPYIRVRDKELQGIIDGTFIHLSLTHDANVAMAIVIVEKATISANKGLD